MTGQGQTGAKRPAGEGERAARRGYVHQDRASARLIYGHLLERSLRWIGLADRTAGVADDLVLGLANSVVAHQFKRAETPRAIGITALLLGTDGTIADLAASFAALRARYPGATIQLRYLTNDYPATNDILVKGGKGTSSAAFLREWSSHRRRTLTEWRATRWQGLIDALAERSGLADAEFEIFWMSFDLVVGPAAEPVFLGADSGSEAQIASLARFLSTMVADHPDKDHWSRAELLDAVGWRDRFALRFVHDFPIGAYVQRNEVSEAGLAAAIRAAGKGYVSLVGPPGTGKSTLLQREVREHARQHVVRYLAFVPGTAQGQGRGEADSFYEDVNAQLAATGLAPLRAVDDSTRARQQQFEHLLARASARHAEDGKGVVIVVDGLDHVPREEHPDRTLLAALPLPEAIPEGIIFVLGTQRLDFEDIPAAVRQQAGAQGRRVNISPLTAAAVERIADALGLDDGIDRAAIHALTGGHPLVTRYLVQRLLTADAAERAQLMAGELGFGGDLEAIYEAAWRSIDQAPDAAAAKRVLALIAHAEGAIAPECLAEAVSEEAVEAALRCAGHLLDRSDRGWTVFHNSFRLFAQGKPVLRFGAPDPAFSRSVIYGTLADLAAKSPPASPQRWLRFRYLFLAGNTTEALDLAGRAFFMSQYEAGRGAAALGGDIADAIGLLRDGGEAAKLFDLMLADGELDRRNSIMEGATSLIDASLAVGDTEAAIGQLRDRGEEAKHWDIVEALLAEGRTDRARAMFEANSPFRSLAPSGARRSNLKDRDILAWARYALLFLDGEQVDRLIEEGLTGGEADETSDEEADEPALKMIRVQLARARAQAEPDLDVAALAAQWSIPALHQAMIRIDAATLAYEEGDFARAIRHLQGVKSSEATGDLHISWVLAAVRLALRSGATDLARALLAHAPPQGLDTVDKVQRLEHVGPACRNLLTAVALRVAAGLEVEALPIPGERLFRGAQHHLVAIGTAIGSVRAGRALGGAEIGAVTDAALNFLATARTGQGDDWFMGHLMPPVGDVILSGLFNLAMVAGDGADRIAGICDTLLEVPATLFRWWPSFRRLCAVQAYELGGDPADARRRLEAGLASLDVTDPREEVEERAQFAIAFANTGWVDDAAKILRDLRSNAFGVFVPAKKDGIYELWSDMLTNANRDDPGRRAERADVSLRFLDGLSRTEGNDTGWRIARNFLFEASSAGPSDGWAAVRWAAEKGAASLDGIFDTTLRGIVRRATLPTDLSFIAWAHLALPWYSEPHGSTVETAQFIRDVVAATDPGALAEIEQQAVFAIELLAQPDCRLARLRALEDALSARSHDADGVRQAAARWVGDIDQEGTDPEQRSYRHIIDLDGISEALDSEMKYRNARDPEPPASRRSRHVTYGLRSAAIRVINAAAWDKVEPFAAAHPKLLEDADVAVAAARSAMAAGHGDKARALVAAFTGEGMEGWGWPAGSGRLRLHEIRHMLGEADRYELARREFFDEMRNARFGVSSLLWSVDRIFPLVFEKVDWPALWDQLAPQLLSMRESRLGEPPAAPTEQLDDRELVAELFCWALTLGVPALHEQAVAGFRDLIDRSHHDVAIRICEQLVARGSDAALTATTLLTACGEDETLSAHFLPALPALLESEDGGIAGAASYLSMLWGAPLPIERRELPDFYSLHLPEGDAVRGDAAIDEQTRGMVIEDPMGWTAGWLSLVRTMSQDSGISVEHIRWRARQLIQSWGGIDAFGHAASKAFEARLDRIDFRMFYRRPHAVVVLRALRQILGEIMRDGRLSFREYLFLLHRLKAYPEQPGLPAPQPRRPEDMIPVVPHMLWGKDQDAWLDAVAGDVLRPAADRILAEWSRSLVRETRVTALGEYWRGAVGLSGDPGELDEFLDDLPRVIFLRGLFPLYEAGESHASRTAIFEPNILLGEPDRLLIFCPLIAALLGWRIRPGTVHLFEDDEEEEMVRTIWWRSGLPQPVDHDDTHAFGQQVLLSETGLRRYEAQFGPFAQASMAWRHVQAASGDGTPGSRFAASP